MAFISVLVLVSWVIGSIYIGQYAYAVGIFTVYCVALVAGAHVNEYKHSIENEQEY